MAASGICGLSEGEATGLLGGGLSVASALPAPNLLEFPEMLSDLLSGANALLATITGLDPVALYYQGIEDLYLLDRKI